LRRPPGAGRGGPARAPRGDRALRLGHPGRRPRAGLGPLPRRGGGRPGPGCGPATVTIIHLTSSTFFGGPERQMLGLAQALGEGDRTAFFSFREGGRCRDFLGRARREGDEADELAHDTPHFRAAVRELTARLRRASADVLCCHGYKADLLGRPAARRAGVPVVAVARGWTAEDLKVRLYEALDRFALRWMDRVVCVSEGQAVKVRHAGV